VEQVRLPFKVDGILLAARGAHAGKNERNEGKKGKGRGKGGRGVVVAGQGGRASLVRSRSLERPWCFSVERGQIFGQNEAGRVALFCKKETVERER
jgi:hypothetical protein